MTSEKQPRTIQIFLPSGDPSGIRVAEITTSIVRVIEVPRNQMAEFLKMPEAHQVGLYFLVGRENQDEVYIGQSGDVGHRLGQHLKTEKRDWERALVLISLTNNLTQTHALYLEFSSIEKAKQCGRYELVNGNNGQRPHTPIPLKADCDEIHRVGALLLATLGYPIFEALVDPSEGDTREMFFCKRGGVDGKAYYTNEGMVVLKGSSAPYVPSRKTTQPRLISQRDELLDKGVLHKDGDRVVFTKDYLFNSPSGASCLLVLGATNGWKEWKTAAGQTLDDYVGRDKDGVGIEGDSNG